jgi:hypothetical protein
MKYIIHMVSNGMIYLLSFIKGRDIAQALSCWLPTAAAWVQSWVWSSGICGGQSGAGTGFLRVTVSLYSFSLI